MKWKEPAVSRMLLVTIKRRANTFFMKSLFEAATRQELANRINSLREQSNKKWGKMNVFQMLKH
jgi:hypothetical protein